MTIKIASVLIASASLLACGRGSDDSPKAPAAQPSGDKRDAHAEAAPNSMTVEQGMMRDLRITTRQVESRPGGEHVSLLGELAVDQRAYAEVGVPVAARVTRLLVNSGDSVRRGQALAEVTSPDLGRARADYLSARARVTLADAALERKRGLVTENIVPVREVQEAEAAQAEARATLRSARAAIEAFGVEPPPDDVDRGASSAFMLRSPVSGSVIERSAVMGQMLDPATAAFRIGDLSTLWLTVHAFERDAVRIERGAAARVTFAALPGQELRGTVTLVGRQVDGESRTVPVRIDLRNSGSLRPGMSAVASVPIGGAETPILTVPVAALQRVRNEWCVFLPKDESTFEIRRIGRGRDLAGEVEVLSGLRAGETIVVDGAFLLKAQAEKGEADHDEH